MKIQNIKKQLAFTLVELIIVIAIISLLSAIVVVTLNPFSIFQSGRNSQRANDLSTIQSAITRYLSETPITGTAHYLSDLHGYNDLLNAAAEGNFICPNANNLSSLTNYYSLDTSGTNIIDLSNLLNGGYLPRVPKDPSTNSSYRACVDTANNSKVVLFGAKTESSSSTVAAALNTPTPNSGISNGLVGYWKMDEASGTSVADSSGNNYTGTTTGTTVTTGKFGNARNYNGISDEYITTNLAVGSITTISAWAKYNGGGTPMLWRTGPIFSGPDLFVSSGKLYLNTWDNVNNPFCNLPVNATDGNFHLYTSVISSSFTALYYDNYLCGNAIYKNPTSTSFTIGSGAGAQYDWSGAIDDVRVYNKVLSPGEVSALYNWGPSPIAYYRFDEGSGNTAYDGSVNALNGTWNGTGTPRYTSGKYGSAGNFNGSTDYVNLGNSTTVQLTNGTFEAWIKTSAAGSSYRGIVTKQNAEGIFLKDNILIAYDWTTGDKTTSINLADNAWHHVTLTFQNSVSNGSIIYIDGVAVLTTTITISNQTTPVVIGAGSNAAAQTFLGAIDEVKIYSYVRAPAQIQADMN